MMELLVFLVMLFGLFGVITTQYINQYRSAYNLWVEHKVFNKNGKKPENIAKIGSEIESYAREICEINDILCIIYCLLLLTQLSIIWAVKVKLEEFNFSIINLITDAASYFATLSNQGTLTDFTLTIAAFTLTVATTIAVPQLFRMLKISLFQNSTDSKKNAIEKKLFDVWWQYKCHREKHDGYIKEMQPRKLYEILAEEIKNGNIKDATKDEQELVSSLQNKTGNNC